jgi:hypothetical protein
MNPPAPIAVSVFFPRSRGPGFTKPYRRLFRSLDAALVYVTLRGYTRAVIYDRLASPFRR